MKLKSRRRLLSGTSNISRNQKRCNDCLKVKPSAPPQEPSFLVYSKLSVLKPLPQHVNTPIPKDEESIFHPRVQRKLMQNRLNKSCELYMKKRVERQQILDEKIIFKSEGLEQVKNMNKVIRRLETPQTKNSKLTLRPWIRSKTAESWFNKEASPRKHGRRLFLNSTETYKSRPNLISPEENSYLNFDRESLNFGSISTWSSLNQIKRARQHVGKIESTREQRFYYDSYIKRNEKLDFLNDSDHHMRTLLRHRINYLDRLQPRFEFDERRQKILSGETRTEIQ